MGVSLARRKVGGAAIIKIFMEVLMTSDTLSSIAGMLLSLAAAYLPGFSDWFGRLEPVRKRLVMLALLALAAAASVAAACAGWGAALNAAPGCTQVDAWAAARAFALALAANQATYSLAGTGAAGRKDGAQ